MQKRGRALNIVVLGLCVLFILTACSRVPGGERPTDTAAAIQMARTGTQGVVVQPIQNYPPLIHYDTNELVALIDVRNRGNYDLNPQQCFVQITGFDRNLIAGDFGAAKSCAVTSGSLEGKDVYNLEGGVEQIEFRSPPVFLPDGVFEYNPILNYVACYAYQTKAAPEVCVDPLFYQVTSEQKTCIPQDISPGGGQGGPVGLGYVNVDMIGNSKAVFEMTVNNLGGGRVLSPLSQIHNCGESSLQHSDLDKVGYTVNLVGGTMIDCKPRDGMVRMVNNQGKIVCTFQVPSVSAYTTPLQVDLTYNYIQSTRRPLKIIQTPR